MDNKDVIVDELISILWVYKLSSKIKIDNKIWSKIISYYYLKNNTKKLLFYIHIWKKWIVFTVDYYGNDILEKIPSLIAIADEKRKSVIKFNIKTLDDIKTKAISKIVELCVDIISNWKYFS